MDRDNGIDAIIYLQSTIGIVETRERAALVWDAMTPMQQSIIMQVYNEVLHHPEYRQAMLEAVATAPKVLH